MQGSLRSKYCTPNEPKNRAVVNAYLETFDITVKRYASDINLVRTFLSIDWLQQLLNKSFDVIAMGVVVTLILSLLFSVLIKQDNNVSCLVMTVFFLTALCFSILAFLFYREYTLVREFLIQASWLFWFNYRN